MGQERLLERSLFSNYSKNSRPAVNGNDTLDVGIFFILAKVEQLVSDVL